MTCLRRMIGEKASTKRKLVSQSQFDDLRPTVEDMHSEIPKLVSILQDSLVPAKKMPSMQPDATSAPCKLLENQFLIHTSEPQLPMPTRRSQLSLRPSGS